MIDLSPFETDETDGRVSTHPKGGHRRSWSGHIQWRLHIFKTSMCEAGALPIHANFIQQGAFFTASILQLYNAIDSL